MDNGTTRLFLRQCIEKGAPGRDTVADVLGFHQPPKSLQSPDTMLPIIASSSMRPVASRLTNLPRLFYPHGVTLSGLYRLVLLLLERIPRYTSSAI